MSNMYIFDDDVSKTPKKSFKEELTEYTASLFQELEDMTDEQLQKKLLFTELLKDYLSFYGRTVQDDYSDLVPMDFTISDSIDRKMDILKDCIQNKIHIDESMLYPTIQERYELDEKQKGL